MAVPEKKKTRNISNPSIMTQYWCLVDRNVHRMAAEDIVVPELHMAAVEEVVHSSEVAAVHKATEEEEEG